MKAIEKENIIRILCGGVWLTAKQLVDLDFELGWVSDLDLKDEVVCMQAHDMRMDDSDPLISPEDEGETNYFITIGSELWENDISCPDWNPITEYDDLLEQLVEQGIITIEEEVV